MPTWDLLVCLQAFGSTSWGLLLLFIFVFVLAKQQHDNFRRQVLCGADLFKQKRSKYILNRYTFLITRCGYRRRRHRRRRHRRRHRRRCGRRRLRGCVCVCGCVLSLVRLLARLQISVKVSPPAIFLWLYGSPGCRNKNPLALTARASVAQ